ncbi:MAG: Crp/Fnr family transcriptional regulator [Gammaproteobacteria bacterium]
MLVAFINALLASGRILIINHNDLFQVLPQNLQDELASMGQVISLEPGDVLCDGSEESRYLYFPLSGCVSLVASIDGHASMGMALIGKEGVLDATLLAGISTVPIRMVVQEAGSAFRVSAQALQAQPEISAMLSRMTTQSMSLLLALFANTAVCASFHALRPRLAKHLLAVHDRIESDSFHMTHQGLADLLGVRRSAVSIAAHFLQQENCIRYSRGNITITDRKALEANSCLCYRAIKGEN